MPGGLTRAKATLLAGGLAALASAWGPWTVATHATLSGHMMQHLVVMNIAALLFAAALRPPLRGLLAVSTVVQILLLWGWHVPSVFDVARHDLLFEFLMQGSLFAVAFVFWGAVLAHPVGKSWQTIFALLVTAKAFCLFGALLSFSRRLLYVAHGDHGAPEFTALDDQQLAGLFMMASCALVYVSAAVILFVRWMGQGGRSAGDRPSWRQADA